MSKSNSLPPVPASQLAWLDWVRFLAAFVVLITHARGVVFEEYSELASESKGLLTAAFFALTRAGHEAVLVFFVLSGYLVGGKLVERVMAGNFSWRGYLCDRASRIFVPLVPAVIFSFLVANLLGAPDSGWKAVANILSLQGVAVDPLTVNGPLWSLSYEVWFYVLGGAAAVVATRGGSWPFVLLLFSFFIFLYLDPIYLFAWLLGALAFRLRFSIVTLRHIVPSVLVVLILAGLSQLASRPNSMNGFGFLDRRVVELLLAGAMALLIAILASVRGTFRVPAFVSALGNRLASFSYSLYLVHFPFLMVLKWGGLQRSTLVSAGALAIFMGVVAMALLFSYAFYFLFEKNTGRVRALMREALGVG